MSPAPLDLYEDTSASKIFPKQSDTTASHSLSCLRQSIQSVCGVSGSSLGVSATSFDAHNEVPQSENLDVAVSKHSCSSNLDKDTTQWDLLNILSMNGCSEKCATSVHSLGTEEILFFHGNFHSRTLHQQNQWLLEYLNSNGSHDDTKFSFVVCGKNVCLPLRLAIVGIYLRDVSIDLELSLLLARCLLRNHNHCRSCRRPLMLLLVGWRTTSRVSEIICLTSRLFIYLVC